MDYAPDSTPISKPTTKPINRSRNPFLVCFGFSGKIKEKKEQKVNSGDRKKGRWLFSWSILRTKNLGLYEKVNRCKQVHADDKIGRRSQLPDSADAMAPALASAPAEGLRSIMQDKPQRRKSKSAQDIILEHSKCSDGRNSLETGTCQVSLCSDKKLEVKKDKVNLPRSLELGPKPRQNTTSLSKVSTFVLQKQKEKVNMMDGMDRTHERKFGKKSESIYGLSIIMVTLLIMLVWGKLCAVICTSAWLYFIPRLKRVTGPDAGDNYAENGATIANLNMNYEKYKKKVVLEGFLERNHRRTLGILRTTDKDVNLSG